MPPPSPLLRLIEALRDPGRYPHPVDAVEVIETHISVVLLAGAHAYKLKKTLDLGFLDYSTLARRRHACAEEIRRNGTLAPGLYETVVAITGTADEPSLVDDTPELEGAFEYAVRMHRFPQDAQLDRRLDAGALTVTDMERVATCVATYQRTARRVSGDEPHGRPNDIFRPIAENFVQTIPRASDPAEVARLEELRAWSNAEHERSAPCIAARREAGFVRACHGDLHLSNLAEVDGRILAFDCIEFDPNLYCIDVISDTAFLVMDLLVRGRRDLAAVFLDAWLQETGDFPALRLLRHYLVYRSMVRAKVAAIAMSQHQGTERRPHHGRFLAHVELSERIVSGDRGALIIGCGVAGSGKSTIARALVPRLAALRVRSDRERKRLYGLGETESSDSPVDGGIYTPQAHARTYDRLEEAAAASLASGHVTIVDGAFLRREDRDRFRALAESHGAPAVVLHCTAPDDVLRSRVVAREERGDDASEAGAEVLRRQLDRASPTGADEASVTVETTRPLDEAHLSEIVQSLESRLARRIS